MYGGLSTLHYSTLKFLFFCLLANSVLLISTGEEIQNNSDTNTKYKIQKGLIIYIIYGQLQTPGCIK
jgi:hypothetical protein